MSLACVPLNEYMYPIALRFHRKPHQQESLHQIGSLTLMYPISITISLINYPVSGNY